MTEEAGHLGIDCAACRLQWATTPALLRVGDESWTIGLCEDCIKAQNWEAINQAEKEATQ